jgi:hypothetical protein
VFPYILHSILYSGEKLANTTGANHVVPRFVEIGTISFSCRHMTSYASISLQLDQGRKEPFRGKYSFHRQSKWICKVGDCE